MQKWLGLIASIAPFVLMAFGVPLALCTLIVAAVQTAEGIPGATGSMKLASVLDELRVGIEIYNLKRVKDGKTTIDADALVTRVSGVIAIIISQVNEIQKKSAKVAPIV
jgi:hypothetical protein